MIGYRLQTVASAHANIDEQVVMTCVPRVEDLIIHKGVHYVVVGVYHDIDNQEVQVRIHE